MHKLFKYCVNPIYRRFNTIGLSSVYRNKKINELMGGGKHSQHIYGYAADITSNHPNIKTSEYNNLEQNRNPGANVREAISENAEILKQQKKEATSWEYEPK